MLDLLGHEPQVVIRFGIGGNSNEYQVSGWSYPEPGYTWALGPEAIMMLPFPSRPAMLEIVAEPAIQAPVVQQKLRIFANGMLCGEFTLSALSTIRCKIPSGAMYESPQLQIALALPDAFRPCDVYDNPDARRLGLAIKNIAIKPATMTSTNELTEPSGEPGTPIPRLGAVEPVDFTTTISDDRRTGRELMTPVILAQTADPIKYKEMLDLTARVNALFCDRHGFRYMNYVGLKRGTAPWQATYNRIFMLSELVEDGFTGWVLYLDADAFVSDFDFDLRAYLRENASYCLIGASGGIAEWNINAGVLFINLGDPTAVALIADWLSRFQATVPTEYLADANAVWDAFPNDQVLLHQSIQSNRDVFRKTKKEQPGAFNYVDGCFIKQATRESFADLHSRMVWLRSETDRIVARETRSPASYRDLTALADKYGSDKGDVIGNKHGYTHLYEFLFEEFREDSFEFLEIGLLRGGPEAGGTADRQAQEVPSVRMWLEYFPKGYCHGFDISDFQATALDRFRFHRGDLGNPDDLFSLRAKLPKKLRFIIDDGSHASYHQQLAFTHLFGLVERGGFYIIEDLDWQPEEYEQKLPKCLLTRDVFLGYLQNGILDIAFLGAADKAALEEQIGHVLVHRRRSDGVVKMIAVQRS